MSGKRYVIDPLLSGWYRVWDCTKGRQVGKPCSRPDAEKLISDLETIARDAAGGAS